MHFPTLPRRWRMPSSSETLPTVSGDSNGKPPKSARKLSANAKSLRRSSHLCKSASFASKTSKGIVGEPLLSPYFAQGILPSAGDAVTVAIHRTPLPQQEFLRRESASRPDLVSSFTKDWRSQSMSDLHRQSNLNDDIVVVNNNPTSSFTSSSDRINHLGLKRGEPDHATIFKTNLRSSSWRNLHALTPLEGNFKFLFLLIFKFKMSLVEI